MILILAASVVFALLAAGVFILTVLADGMSDAPSEPMISQWPALVCLVIGVALFAEWWFRW